MPTELDLGVPPGRVLTLPTALPTRLRRRAGTTSTAIFPEATVLTGAALVPSWAGQFATATTALIDPEQPFCGDRVCYRPFRRHQQIWRANNFGSPTSATMHSLSRAIRFAEVLLTKMRPGLAVIQHT
jgi:hypothetical protein